MPDRFVDVKYKSLEKQLAELCQEYEVVSAQQGRVLGDVEQLRIGRQLEDLESKIHDVEAKLKSLDRADDDPNQRYQDWKTHLSEIDFTEAMDTFERIRAQIDRKGGGAALLLLQNSYAMGGKWCVARLREMLKAKTADFRLWEIEFATQVDEYAWLAQLGQYVGWETSTANTDVGRDEQMVSRYVQAIAQRICDSMQSGSVAFIELRLWDTLLLQDRFLPWLLREFWAPLVCDLWPALMRHHPLARIILVIQVYPPWEPTSLPPILTCTGDDFDGSRVLELPLRAWALEEIRNWLYQFSRLDSPPANLTVSQIDTVADTIYRISGGGQPDRVEGLLMEMLPRYFAAHHGGRS